MSRTRGTAISVSLFPFLAVLICAMGALIFLLIVTTRRIRSDARAELLESKPVASIPAPLPPVDPIPQPPPVASKVEPVDLDAPLRTRIQQLQTERDRARSDLSRQQETTTQVANAVRQVATNAADLESRLKRLRDEQNTGTQNRTVLAAERLKLSEQADALAARAVKVRRDQAAAQSKYTFVAFDGQSGTIRRPILIECTAEGLRFLPEDILLREKDLKGFIWDSNPLLEGSRALIAYWTAKQRVDHPDAEAEPEPYILMVVRPRGAAAFYAARKMLRNLKQPYGYELLQGDRELDLPEPDEQARRVCQLAIDRMLAIRDRDIKSFANGGTGRSGTIGYRRGTGERYDPDLERSLLGGNGSGKRGADGTGNGRNPTGRNLTGRHPDGVPGGGTSVTPGTGRPNGTLSGLGPFDGSGDQDDGIQNGGARRRRGGSLVLELPPDNTSTGDAKGDPRAQLGTDPEFGNPNRSPGANDPANVGQRGFPDGTQNGENAGTGNPSQTFRPRQTGSPSVTRPSERSASQTPSARSESQVTFPDFGRNDNARGGSTRSGSSNGGSASGGSRETLERILEQRWGRSRRRGTIGYERDVPIVVYADRILVAGKLEVPVGQGESAAELAEAVVRAIDEHAGTWEPPPNRFYWVPTVRFRVGPGGNLYYERLHGRLNRLGIGTSVDFTLDSGTRSQKPE
jgi:hypothetical protein